MSKEATAAMYLFSDRYANQDKGCIDFYCGLPASEQHICKELVDAILDENEPRHQDAWGFLDEWEEEPPPKGL